MQGGKSFFLLNLPYYRFFFLPGHFVTALSEGKFVNSFHCQTIELLIDMSPPGNHAIRLDPLKVLKQLIPLAFIFLSVQTTESQETFPLKSSFGPNVPERFKLSSAEGTAERNNTVSDFLQSAIITHQDRGLTDQLDLKVFFFRNIRQEVNDGFNVIQITPKIGIKFARLSLYVPVGIWQQLIPDSRNGTKNEKLVFFSPRINSEIIKRKSFDLCLGAYLEIPHGKELHNRSYYGITAGLGYSSRKKAWFLRTEYSFDIASLQNGWPVCNIGLTIGYNIFPHKGRYRDLSAKHDRFFTSIANLTNLFSRK
jgi:hypothetical protein